MAMTPPPTPPTPPPTTTDTVVYESGYATPRAVYEEYTTPYTYYDFDLNEMVETTQKRLLRIEHPGGRTEYFGGMPGREGRVLVEDKSTGQSFYFAGARHKEHIVRKRTRDGDNIFFDGPKGEERRIRVEFANGNILFFDGPRGEERRLIGQTEGVTAFYEGPKGEEKLVAAGKVKMATYEKIG